MIFFVKLQINLKVNLKLYKIVNDVVNDFDFNYNKKCCVFDFILR